ncbi:RagB/SusD family nutrient uptake outer membrane protein [Aquiflexum sp.]|uniref:RagB/SusD family nutrient uptake outer membrane protein n=1 Tax=Aquiflexum sp. TaxID=1872584 RepID=UPI0035942EA7
MKEKLFKIMVIAIVFVSCDDDLLDKYPADTLNPSNFWTSESDAEAAVNNLYTRLPEFRGWMYREILSDYAIGSSGDEGRNNVNEGTNDANAGFYRTLWNDYFRTIAATNYFLENIDKVPNLSVSVRNRMSGEARFIRSFAYLNLIMDFGDAPLITRSLTVSEGASIARTGRFEIFNFILNEMDDIVDDIPSRTEYIGAGKGIGRVTSGAVLAIKARASLFAGTLAKNFSGPAPVSYFQACVSACQDILNSGEYNLFNDFGRLFKYDGQYSNEVILSRMYSKDVLSHNFFNNNAPQELTGRATVDLSISRDLVNRFQMQATGRSISDPLSTYNPNDPHLGRDPRMEHTVFFAAFDNTSHVSIVNGRRWDMRPNLPADLKVADVLSQLGGANKTGYAVRKYIDEDRDAGQGNNDGMNLILFRYADVLLMYAEALVELNQEMTKAVDLIDMIRTRAGMPVLSESGYTASDFQNQNTMRSIVHQERSVEMALEGLRIFDIRRWKIAENVIDGPVPGISYIDYETGELVHHNWFTRVRIFDPARDYLFPVPEAERQINPNLGQNTNW